ncbi:MAG: hypothetical protein LKI22_03355 [Liquorilactobacillus nagelii]|jgi:hypothetical protein|uniref:hypothetical protein n=1 Tax=Liquorilactobacillus nagelii TaxID=82688 RepID=UPI00242CEE4A|nr:hypothetical protein [Liquorilactobacillus nagelii]MCI1632975.1 hypothetical protein [Liquorilactobacillus nagelii]
MKFADYFKEAIAYGKSLGFRNGKDRDFAVELDESRTVEHVDGTHFYPSFLIVWKDSGINVCTPICIEPEITVEQQLKLIKLFIAGYEQYLADKKEPVAADSAE